MSRKPILYLSFSNILGAAAGESEENQKAMALSFGREAKGKPLVLGSIEVGQCIDYELDMPSRRVGLVIEWRSEIQIVTKV